MPTALAAPPPLQIGRRRFVWGERTYLMGIINVTPDSFSGDGLAGDLAAMVAQAKRFAAEGADILDIGGESTRPGHAPVSLEAELARVLPAVEAVRGAVDLPISVDTQKAAVARAALAAGADCLNDIWGLRGDPAMAGVAAEFGMPVIAMHNQHGTEYREIMADIAAGLRESLAVAARAGIALERVILDPGIGFGKTWEQNLVVLNRLGELRALGRPLLLGTSRKSFIGRILGTPEQDRLEGTAASVALGIDRGADLVRVHDVGAMARVARVADAIVRR
jgi:dihydropteroate synthase